MRFYWLYICILVLMLPALGWAIDLLERYPTTLTSGDTSPDRARPWEFSSADLYRISRFKLEVGEGFLIEIGQADLGIGHCTDGAVWAVVIPRTGGKLTSKAALQEELISHLWLRFHPGQISRLFPRETVFTDDISSQTSSMRIIAKHKMQSSWQASGNAMIPEPKDMTVDVDTTGGPRRFFIVDMEALTAEYVSAFEARSVKLPPAITPALAEAAFDQLWETFDREYAMFVLRPEVDWARLREKYRPLALRCKSVDEFTGICADLLKNFRDLHIWLTVAGTGVPVYNRPRTANSNPSAHAGILGNLEDAGQGVNWAITPDNIGYIAIYGWTDSSVPETCGEVLKYMRNTRGLIVDVRLNGGGDEPSAQQFAGRFLQQEFVYAYSRYRNGPKHTDLTEKFARSVKPSGPWRYNRPLVVLIGQKCMSSNESFIAMMTGASNVTTMGDHTCGSSGNPKIVNLPLEMTVSVPRWIDYLPDGTPLDERGVQPQVTFQPASGAFEGNRDDLLSAALERLRQVPLPDKPIDGSLYER